MFCFDDDVDFYWRELLVELFGDLFGQPFLYLGVRCEVFDYLS